MYLQALQDYDNHLAEHPADFKIYIEKCKLIELAYYDAYEDYSLNYEEADSCRQQLKEAFPNEPEVLLFEAEYTWGDDALDKLEDLMHKVEKNPVAYKDLSTWKLYQRLAELYKADEQHYEAIAQGKVAMQKNDTLDLSLLVARSYKEVDETKKAINILLENVDSTDAVWTLNQKGKLLLELGDAPNALMVFNYAKKDTSGWIDNGALANTLIEMGMIADAREYLLKDLKNSWPLAKAQFDLFQFDLEHGQADSARASYERFVDGEFSADMLGKHRLELFFKFPALGWSLADIGRILLLLLTFVFIGLAPYLYLLPVNYLGNIFDKRGFYFSPNGFSWTLKQVWILSSLYLLVYFGSMYFFSYDAYLSYFTDVYVGEEIEDISQTVADSDLFFTFSLLILTIPFIKKFDVQNFWGSKWTKQYSILLGFGVGYVLLSIYGSIVLEYEGQDVPAILLNAVSDSTLSVNKYYHPILGYIVVAILPPFYEEIMFRGVVLSGLEKKIPFLWANVIQAFIFMSLHEDTSVFPFLFAFGFVAGVLRHKSQSLAPGMAMHFMNNTLAYFAIIGVIE